MADNSCHCFCGAVHRAAMGICTGQAETSLTFHGGVARDLGMPPTSVPMCTPCAMASDGSPTTARKNVNS